jgi:hypothetical protein
MKYFPKLEITQVAVMIADGATGHILNTDGSINIDGTEDEIYFIFDNLNSAKKFIRSHSFNNDKVEYVIYDRYETVLEFVEARH